MADKAFGVKDFNLIGASGTPTIESPNNLNINAVNVAISTDITVAGKVSLGTGTSISSPGTNILTLGTNSAERVRITSAGRLGVGLASPNSNLHIKGGSDSTDNLLLTLQSNGVASDGSLSTGFRLINSTSDTSIHGADIRAIRTGSNSTDLTFSLYNGSNPQTERLRLTSAGNLKFATSGTGIDFSATSDASGMSSELLADYEEGTWTPTSGTNMGTFTNADGAYVRIGNTVTVNFFFTTASVSTSNASYIGGLPYAVTDSISGTSVEATGVVFEDFRMYLMWASGGGSTIAVETDRPIQGSTSSASQTLRGSITYLTT